MLNRTCHVCVRYVSVCAVAVSLLACSASNGGGGAHVSAGGSNSSSEGGSPSSGGSPAVVGASGAVNINTDAGPSTAGSGPVDVNNACGIAMANASLAPLNMFVMFDDSRSMDMNNKWTEATTALKSFFGDPSTTGLRAALRLFPAEQPATGCNDSDCSTDACKTMLVPLGPLTADAAPTDTQEAALDKALSGRTNSGGGTPLSAALAGAEQAASDYQTAHKDERTVVVLVTDGAPNGCVEDISAIAKLAADAKTLTGQLTYAIGLQGSNESDMNAIAVAGGTTQGFFLGASSNAQTDLLMALSAIRGKSLSCDFPLPAATGGGAVDPTKVNVSFTPTGGTQMTLAQVTTQAACAQGDGWYYDNPTSPSRIFLCPHSCDGAHGDVSAKLQILLGCETQVAVPK